MVGYAAEVERMMARLFDSLKESDRRRYAAIEATWPAPHFLVQG